MIENTAIGIEEILEEVNTIQDEFKMSNTNKASNILDELINKIERVDWSQI